MLSPPMPNTPGRFRRVSRVSTADPISLVMKRISDLPLRKVSSRQLNLSDGRTTGIEPARGGFTIHCLDPLGYIRPYPHTGGKKASRSRSFLAKLQTKQRGWAVHFIDLTSLYLRLKIGAGRAVKAHLVDSERAASTYSYQNEKQQAELEEALFYKPFYNMLRSSKSFLRMLERIPFLLVRLSKGFPL
ncbi:hypothetical protein PHJA_003006900 [Phtheirospermum japonicum]|uniref:Uncharacterized protein n=1 Tax=Phtheirospermum japonicum TaxID=374723 RepID=A0A830DG68_9LAMI|nr:hypothetical protein PHJA_003006900 [Phtheirospermum japonicum]